MTDEGRGREDGVAGTPGGEAVAPGVAEAVGDEAAGREAGGERDETAAGETGMQGDEAASAGGEAAVRRRERTVRRPGPSHPGRRWRMSRRS